MGEEGLNTLKRKKDNPILFYVWDPAPPPLSIQSQFSPPYSLISFFS
jgi:hypothetical protein